MNKVEDPGNNESRALGLFDNQDGTFTGLTHSASKTLKTRKGIEDWLARRGYTPEGETA